MQKQIEFDFVDKEKNRLINDYNLTINQDGYILNPGKFEGERLTTIYFYDAFLNGDGEYIDDAVQEFQITKEDIAIFPELAGYKTFTLGFLDNGFVFGYPT